MTERGISHEGERLKPPFAVKVFLPDKVYEDIVKKSYDDIVVIHEAEYWDNALSSTDSALIINRENNRFSLRTNLHLSPALLFPEQDSNATAQFRLQERIRENGFTVEKDNDKDDTWHINRGDFSVAVTQEDDEVAYGEGAKKTVLRLNEQELSSDGQETFVAAYTAYAEIYEAYLNSLYTYKDAPSRTIILNESVFPPTDISEKRTILEPDIRASYHLPEELKDENPEPLSLPGIETDEVDEDEIIAFLGDVLELSEFEDYVVTAFDKKNGVLRLEDGENKVVEYFKLADGTIIRRKIDLNEIFALRWDTYSAEIMKDGQRYSYEVSSSEDGISCTLDVPRDISKTVGSLSLWYGAVYQTTGIQPTIRGNFSVPTLKERHGPPIGFKIQKGKPYIEIETGLYKEDLVPFGKRYIFERNELEIHSSAMKGDSIRIRVANTEQHEGEEVYFPHVEEMDPELVKALILSEDPETIALLPLVYPFGIQKTDGSLPLLPDRKNTLLDTTETSIQVIKKMWQEVQTLPILTPESNIEEAALSDDLLFDQLTQFLYDTYPHEEAKRQRIAELYSKKKMTKVEKKEVIDLLPNYRDLPNLFLIAVKGLSGKRRELRDILLGVAKNGGNLTAWKKVIEQDVFVSSLASHIITVIPGRFSYTLAIDNNEFAAVRREEGMRGFHKGWTIWNVVPDIANDPVKTVQATIAHEDFHSFAERVLVGQRVYGESSHKITSRVQRLGVIRKQGKTGLLGIRLQELTDSLDHCVDYYHEELLAEFASSMQRDVPTATFATRSQALWGEFYQLLGIDTQADKILKRKITEIMLFPYRIVRLYRAVGKYAPEKRDDLDAAFALFPPSKVRHIEALVERWVSQSLSHS